MQRFGRISWRPSYANVVATIALFVALGGSAEAAKKYLITSPKQIKPSVLEQLRGSDGVRGPAGPQGEAGASGEIGPQGERGATGAAGIGAGGSIAALAQQTAEVVTASTHPGQTPTYAAVSLSGDAWTQQSGELNELVGEVRLRVPDRSQCSTNPGGYENPASAIVRLKIDGTVIGAATVNTAFGADPVQTIPISWGSVSQFPGNVTFDGPYQGRQFGVRFPGASTASHVLTADTADSCGVEGGTATKHFTVESVKVFAIAVQ